MVLDEKWLGLATSLTSSMLAETVRTMLPLNKASDSITLPVILIGFGNIAALYLDVLFATRFRTLEQKFLTI
jgi:vacuolar-type H+-ATPase subunit I/STV1